MSLELQEALGNVCAMLNVRKETSDLNGDTRCNSTFEMMNAIMNLWKTLEKLTHQVQERHEGYCNSSFTLDDYPAYPTLRITSSTMMNLRYFLVPFKKAAVLLQTSEYSILGMVVPSDTIIVRRVSQAIAHAY